MYLVLSLLSHGAEVDMTIWSVHFNTLTQLAPPLKILAAPLIEEGSCGWRLATKIFLIVMVQI